MIFSNEYLINLQTLNQVYRVRVKYAYYNNPLDSLVNYCSKK